MRRRSTIFGIALLTAIAAGLVYVALTMERSSAQSVCWVCDRPVHEHSRVVGLFEGRRDVFCCPACALSAHRQTGKTIRILELTDYETDSRLNPTDAILVRGSNVNLCSGHRPLIDSAKQSYAMEYDRCSPSLLAFSSSEKAEAFAAEHGGAVIPFSELAAELGE